MVRRLIFEACANCSKKIVDDEAAIVVDEHNDLIFCDMPCVEEYFEAEINALEQEHLKNRGPKDIPVPDFPKFENYVAMLLNEPDEIWEVETPDDEAPLSFYIGEFFHESEHIYYVAAVYQCDEKPSFVYMHFPTNDMALVEKYRRGELIFDGAQETEFQLEEDDMDDENVASKLYNEMLDNRSDIDIDPEDFSAYNDLKLATVEKPEEIWRQVDEDGNTFIIYVAHHQRDTETVGYIVVAVEDEMAGGAVPAFGFPTLDQKLLERFRVGDLLFKAEENF